MGSVTTAIKEWAKEYARLEELTEREHRKKRKGVNDVFFNPMTHERGNELSSIIEACLRTARNPSKFNPPLPALYSGIYNKGEVQAVESLHTLYIDALKAARLCGIETARAALASNDFGMTEQNAAEEEFDIPDTFSNDYNKYYRDLMDYMIRENLDWMDYYNKKERAEKRAKRKQRKAL